MIVAIHQPNFFPWLGYFNKLAHADLFVALDNVQFQKTGGTWMNRVKLKIGGEARWVTAPVVRAFHGVRTVGETHLAPSNWRDVLLRTLESAYARAPHFREVFPFLAELVADPSEKLADFNLTTINALAGALRLGPSRIVQASRVGVRGKGTDLLIDIVRAVGGTAYLCGGGAAGYQEDAKFGASGLSLVYQDFRHPVYPQVGGGFVPGLSIIDALMNCGFAGTRELVVGVHVDKGKHSEDPASRGCRR